MTEKEKMLAGELYNGMDPDLVAERMKARMLLRSFNNSRPDELEWRENLLRDLLRAEGRIWIEPPFYCDYGFNISVGDNFYANFDCVILDVCAVTIGCDVLLAPKVQIYTATHPVDPELRRAGQEFGKPVSIGSSVWIGGGAIICPGVTIGSGSVIGAGSVVTRDVPEGVVAAGNPSRIIRPVDRSANPLTSRE